MKIADLIVDGIKPEPRIFKKAEIVSIEKKKVDFEKTIFNYFCENRFSLGITEVYALENMLVDGAVRLKDGRLILIECKYILNWKNECNARVEIQEFCCEKLIPEMSDPSRALIVFKEFGGDWKTKAVSRKHVDGWTKFYEEENTMRGAYKFLLPIDIAQLTDKGLINPLAAEVK